MNKILTLILALIIKLILVPTAASEPIAASPEHIKVLIPRDVLADYNRFLNGRNVLEINTFIGEGSRRDVVEVILMQQALSLGGINTPIEFIQHDAYQRILIELHQGRAHITATSNWLTDLKAIQDQILITHPIINNGEFEAGFYTLPNNQHAQSAKNIVDIRLLSIVSSKGWKVDWNTLSKLKMNKLKNNISWLSMVRMVNAGRVDMLLAPFQATEDLSLTVENIRLIPIPNVKIGLQGSRHFGISKHYSHAKQLASGFNRGLSRLITQGVIKKAYSQSGFINARVANWKKLDLEE